MSKKPNYEALAEMLAKVLRLIVNRPDINNRDMGSAALQAYRDISGKEP